MHYYNDHKSFSEYSRQLIKEAATAILKAEPNIILSGSSDELLEQFSRNYTLEKTLIYSDKKDIKPIRRIETIPSHKREVYQDEGDLQFECEYIQVRIPISSSRNLESYRDLQPSSYTLNWHPENLEIQDDFVKFEVLVKGYNFKASDQQVERDFQQQVQQTVQWISNLNQDIDKHNAELKHTVLEAINARKKNLEDSDLKMNALLQKLN